MTPKEMSYHRHAVNEYLDMHGFTNESGAELLMQCVNMRLTAMTPELKMELLDKSSTHYSTLETQVWDQAGIQPL